MNNPTNGNNSYQQQSIIIELKKTQQGYTVENQLTRMRKISYTEEDNTNRNQIILDSVNWAPQDVNFTIRTNQSEYQQKSREDYIGINQALLKEQQQIKKCLPFYSRWFNFQSISHIEKESLPEFFLDKPSKTPEIYIRVRNFIVQCYWKDPKTYLTATACRRCICGDVSSVLRIHAFLEHWGIINSSYNPSSFDISNVLKQNFYFPVFQKSYEQKLSLKSFSSKSMHDQIKSNLFQDLKVERPTCFSCDNQVDEDWFEQKKLKIPIRDHDLVCLCRQCFIEEKLPIMLAPQDFDHVNVFQKTEHQEQNKVTFSMSDNIKLLQSLKEIDGNIDNLNLILEKFPNATKSSILIQILRLGLQNEESLGELESYGIYHNELTYLQNAKEGFQKKLIQFTELLGKNKCTDLKKRIEKLQQRKTNNQQISQKLQIFHQQVIKKKLQQKLEYFRIKEKLMRYHQNYLVKQQKSF